MHLYCSKRQPASVHISESDPRPPSAASCTADEAVGGGEDCLYCDQTFPGRPDLLAAHLAQHASCLEPRCGLCGATFATESHLLEHARDCGAGQLIIAAAAAEDPVCPGVVVAAGERPHICPICEKPFKSASRLKVHSGEHDTAPC
jgi:uncharacterized Zn-finger protein